MGGGRPAPSHSHPHLIAEGLSEGGLPGPLGEACAEEEEEEEDTARLRPGRRPLLLEGRLEEEELETPGHLPEPRGQLGKARANHPGGQGTGQGTGLAAGGAWLPQGREWAGLEAVLVLGVGTGSEGRGGLPLAAAPR